MKPIDIAFLVVFFVIAGATIGFDIERNKSLDERFKMLSELDQANKKNAEDIIRKLNDIEKSIDVLESRRR